jgi:4-hydroxy 2-oxovalerate aldolase
MTRQAVNILETTLRDGSYLIDFRFTAADTAWLARELEACGIGFIEIGHGLGLGASKVHAPAAASDEDYVKAAHGALTRAKFGMFAIPGVAKLDDLAMAADLGMDFVRIGANVDRVKEMQPFVAEARKRGLFVCTNFMKSYCMPPDTFGEVGAMAESFGSQMNYVVDSAGGMLPQDVRLYFEALAKKTTVPMGFHGHDNIRLAIANSLIAIECGALYVDTTLFGIGRGSGNAATELVAAIMKQRFAMLDQVDELRLMQLAEREAAPLMHNRHQETVSEALGLAQVHSMYLDAIVERAQQEDIDPHELIARVGKIDRLTVTERILDQAVAAVRSSVASPRSAGGSVLDIPLDGPPAATVAAAENVAEKINLPCHLWIAGGIGDTAIDVVKTPMAIEVRVFGDPSKAVDAIARPITHVVLAPRAIARWGNIKPRDKGTRVEVAVHDPAWLDDQPVVRKAVNARY